MEQFILRSALFVPGNRPDRIEKALTCGADAVIIDLEDSVPLSEKSSARENARQMLERYSDGNIIVRVNSLNSEFFADDISNIVSKNLYSVIMPKVDSEKDVLTINQILSEAEKNNNIEIGTVSVMPLIESALAVQNVFEIVSVKTEPKRLLTAAFGAVDYTADMGIELSKDGEELVYPRARIAVACRAASIEPPIDAPYIIDLKNEDGIRADALRAKRLGFGGKLCVHPVQVSICNEVFSPSSQEIDYAGKIVEAYENARNKGLGAIALDGKMVDVPVYKNALRIFKIAAMKK